MSSKLRLSQYRCPNICERPIHLPSWEKYLFNR